MKSNENNVFTCKIQYHTYHIYYGHADRFVFWSTWKNPLPRFERFLQLNECVNTVKNIRVSLERVIAVIQMQQL